MEVMEARRGFALRAFCRLDHNARPKVGFSRFHGGFSDHEKDLQFSGKTRKFLPR